MNKPKDEKPRYCLPKLEVKLLEANQTLSLQQRRSGHWSGFFAIANWASRSRWRALIAAKRKRSCGHNFARSASRNLSRSC